MLKANSMHTSTRNQILEASLHLFAKNGLKGTTIREIAALAGVNISAINYHFENKESLYRYVIQQRGEEGNNLADATLDRNFSSKEEFRVRMLTFADLLMKSVLEKPDYFFLLENEMLQGLPFAKEEFKNFIPKIIHKIELFLIAAKERGFLYDDLDCRILAIAFYPLLFSHFRDHKIIKEFFNIDFEKENIQNRVVNQTMEMFLRGIMKPD